MTELAIPGAAQNLEKLSLKDRIELEDTLDELLPAVRKINDAEIRQLHEAGASQRAIAEACGKSHTWVRIRLGLREANPKVESTFHDIPQNGDNEDDVYDDAEEVDPDEVLDPNEAVPPGSHYLPDVMAEDANENLRTVVLRWFEWGLHVKELLDNSTRLEAKSAADREEIRNQAGQMVDIASHLKEVI